MNSESEANDSAAAMTANVLKSYDLLPLNARHLQTINGRVVFVLSCTLNSVLITLLATERNKLLRAYSNILMLNCACDLFYTFCSVLLDVQAEYKRGQFAAVIGGPYSQLSFAWANAGLELWLTSLYMAIFIIPLVFYFRYSLIAKNVRLPMRHLLKLLPIPVAASLLVSTCLPIACYYDNREVRCEDALSHPIYTYRGASIHNCLITSATNPFTILHILMIGVTNVCMYCLMGYCSWHIFKTLRSAKLGDKTAKLHRQMNILLIAQMLIPMFCAGAPLALIIVFTFLDFTVNGLGIVTIMSLEWIPLMNPLITILFVTNYRRRAVHFVATVWRRCLRLHPATTSTMAVTETGAPSTSG